MAMRRSSDRSSFLSRADFGELPSGLSLRVEDSRAAAMAPTNPSSSARVSKTATGDWVGLEPRRRSISKAAARPARSSKARLRNLRPRNRPATCSNIPGEWAGTGAATRRVAAAAQGNPCVPLPPSPRRGFHFRLRKSALAPRPGMRPAHCRGNRPGGSGHRSSVGPRNRDGPCER